MVDTRKNREWQVTSGSVKSTTRGRIVCRKKLKTQMFIHTDQTQKRHRFQIDEVYIDCQL